MPSVIYTGIPRRPPRRKITMAALESIGAAGMDGGIDPNASPLDSVDTNTTPDTQFSPPDSPYHLNGSLKATRMAARKKLAQLSLDEKVRVPLNEVCR